jgi:hypothetical protein
MQKWVSAEDKRDMTRENAPLEEIAPPSCPLDITTNYYTYPLYVPRYTSLPAHTLIGGLQ